jgi:hypothetical protein
MDALAMNFPDNTFDLVWACESGEHMPDKKRCAAAAAAAAAAGCVWVALPCCCSSLLHSCSSSVLYSLLVLACILVLHVAREGDATPFHGLQMVICQQHHGGMACVPGTIGNVQGPC